MGIIWTLIIGLVAGIVAKFLMPGRDPGGFIITILLGVAGAFLATWLGQAVGWYQNHPPDRVSAGETAKRLSRGGALGWRPRRLGWSGLP